MGGIEIRVAADVDGALRGLPVAERGAALGRQKQRGLLQRQDRHSLLLGVEEDAEARELLAGRGGALLLGDQRRLAGEGFERLVARLVSHQDHGEHQCHADGSDDREGDCDELARAERPHGLVGWIALYPAPRTVRIRSGRASLRRSCATWTSTVRVPPA